MFYFDDLVFIFIFSIEYKYELNLIQYSTSMLGKYSTVLQRTARVVAVLQSHGVSSATKSIAPIDPSKGLATISLFVRFHSHISCRHPNAEAVMMRCKRETASALTTPTRIYFQDTVSSLSPDSRHKMANVISQSDLDNFRAWYERLKAHFQNIGYDDMVDVLEEMYDMGHWDSRLIHTYIKPLTAPYSKLESVETTAYLLSASKRSRLRTGEVKLTPDISDTAIQQTVAKVKKLEREVPQLSRFKTQGSLLLQLPGELRNDIYRLALHTEAGVIIRQDKKGFSLQTPALLRVCKQMRVEVSSFFWAETSVFVQICGDDWKLSLESLETVAAERMREIASIQCEWKLDDSEEAGLNTLLNTPGPFRIRNLTDCRINFAILYIHQVIRSRKLMLHMLRRGMRLDSISAVQEAPIESTIKFDEAGSRALLARHWRVTVDRERQVFLDAVRNYDASEEKRSSTQTELPASEDGSEIFEAKNQRQGAPMIGEGDTEDYPRSWEAYMDKFNSHPVTP
ncbi:uncharacterized protein MYCFIDRAFT_207939 [Pseudocercospora fijiensis CIRAD86]|uniref:Uncharacterized protein n=1 Tax=Pseudocercospora fijiensis (strain CIRAD86) TaxID=383855 RepID=M3AXF7_PSEFD|nr:uncharacterized protein MYCFIDRAFT_207939 [Pseudocercospora fijiensis CIRAD86]EME81763.1 hypothetical protein MYCFIDRAFT_207939 [Pseudocercospora fijiensis CIRAD86]